MAMEPFGRALGAGAARTPRRSRALERSERRLQRDAWLEPGEPEDNTGAAFTKQSPARWLQR